MAEEKCQEYARMETEAHDTLKEIMDLTAAQLRAFNESNAAEFTRLDRQLENVVGHKERVVGALRAHAADHGCKRAFMLFWPASRAIGRWS